MSGIDIETIKKQIDSEREGINSSQGLEEFRVRYLGRKGIIAQLTSTIPNLPVEERGTFGQQVNNLKNRIINTENSFLGIKISVSDSWSNSRKPV